MNSLKTIVTSSLVVLALLFATSPVSAANRLANGDFETCDLTGWSFVPSEKGWLSDVYDLPLLSMDGCSFATLDQAVIQQTFPIVAGETFTVSFEAALIPVVSTVNSLNLIDDRCSAADGSGPSAGRVVLEFLAASAPGLQPQRMMTAIVIDFAADGAFSATAPAAPTGATHARLMVSGCPAVGGAVFDNIVVDAI